MTMIVYAEYIQAVKENGELKRKLAERDERIVELVDCLKLFASRVVGMVEFMPRESPVNSRRAAELIARIEGKSPAKGGDVE